MSDVKFTVEAVLDSKQAVRAFGQVEKAGQDAAKKVGNSFNQSGSGLSGINDGLSKAQVGFTSLGSTLSKFALPLLGVSAALASVKKGFDLILSGEQDALELNIFNAAAERAGVNAQNLLKSLESANAGIGDVGEISKIAALGLNELGSEAERYPQLLEAARKLSIQFGTDVTDTFDQLNQAILSGRTRGLGSQFGIFVNQEQALRDYAATIGTVSTALTDQEKRVATLNAVLKASEITTAGVNLANETLAVNLARLQTSIVELGKALGARLLDTLGTDIKTITRDFANFFELLKGFIQPQSEAEKLTERLKEVNEEIALTTKQSEFLGPVFNLLFGRSAQSTVAGYNQELIKISTKLGEINNQAAAQANRGPQNVVIPGLSDDELRIQEANLLKANERLAQIRLEASQQQLQAKLSTATVEEALQLQIESARLVHEQKLTQIAKENEQLRFVDKQLLNEIQLAEEERFNAQVTKLKADAGKVQTEEQKRQAQLQVQIAQAANQATTNVLSQGIQALGASLVVGSSAFDNFGQTVLNILGDLMINIGQSILAAQIALQQLFISLTNPANAFAGIATAIALIGVGAALKAVASSGNANASAATSAPAPTFSGGVTDTGGLPVVEPRDDLRQRQAEQQVSVVINGDVLDSDQSGIRIVELINSAFDKQGVTVRRGVMA